MRFSSSRRRDASRRQRIAGALALAVGIGVVAGRPSPAATVDHAPWDRLLRTYVDDDGTVAYADLRARDREALAGYLRALADAEAPPDGSAEAKAFWINAYNAGVVSAVLDGYSAEGLLRRHALFKRFTFAVAGRGRTLDEIEHRIVRPRLRDARTHFVLVCASSSCPRLRRGAYEPASVEQALDEEARRFVNDPRRNRIDAASGTVELSEIFEWFADDFVRDAGSVGAFVARYVATDAQRALLRARRDRFPYRAYDWTLNAQAGQRP